MSFLWKNGLVGALVVLLSVGSALANDQEQESRKPTSGEMFADAVAARPLGLIATAIGAVAFVVSLPFTLPSHSADDAAKMLVNAPAKYTFKRPLGRFVSCEEQPDYCK
jgi:hypothetical protein